MAPTSAACRARPPHPATNPRYGGRPMLPRRKNLPRRHRTAPPRELRPRIVSTLALLVGAALLNCRPGPGLIVAAPELAAAPAGQSTAPPSAPQPRARARDLGIPFEGAPGPYNAITDVQGVEV